MYQKIIYLLLLAGSLSGRACAQSWGDSPGKQVTGTIEKSGDLGTISLISEDLNDFNTFLLQADTSLNSDFETQFTLNQDTDPSKKTRGGSWGTNEGRLSLINFYLNPGESAYLSFSTTVAVERSFFGNKMEWQYTSLSSTGKLAAIEYFELER